MDKRLEDTEVVFCNAEQQLAISRAVEGHNIFLHGSCGTGKTHVIRHIVRLLRAQGRTVAVTGTSGVSSLLLKEFQSSTIHHWAGLQDGRHDTDDLVHAVEHMEDKIEVKTRLVQCDTLVIDELGMLSASNFKKLEELCRRIRHNTVVFGGIQVVGCGSFKQLPPVPNYRYGDDGSLCFNCDTFSNVFPHIIKLIKVVRTKDVKLIKAVHELCDGQITTDTEKFLSSLSRPINSKNATRLFTTNLDCCIVNEDMLYDGTNPDSIKHYKAIDSGDRSQLLSIRTPKLLKLKIGCPVIMTTNYTRTVVNGLQGTVHKLPQEQDGAITVNFNGKFFNVFKKKFEIYDKEKRCNVACRIQYPLCLSYAVTIHRVQGQTLQSLIVDCHGTFKAGQVGVAIGRATCTANLQVLNFSEKHVLRHPPEVYEFDNRPSKPYIENLSCCTVAVNEQLPAALPTKPPFITIPNATNTDLTIQYGNQSRDHDYSPSLPNSIDIIDKLKCKYTDEESMMVIDDQIDDEYILTFSTVVAHYAREAINAKNKCVMYTYFNGKGLEHRKKLFNLTNEDNMTHKQAKFSFDIIDMIWKYANEIRYDRIVKKDQNEMCEQLPQNAIDNEHDLHEKIYHLSGYAIQSLTKHTSTKLKISYSSVHSSVEKKTEHIKLKLLQNLRITEDQALNTSTIKEVLGEVNDKQYKNRGLTYVDAPTYQFFKKAFELLKKFQQEKFISFYGELLFTQMFRDLHTNTDLLSTWHDIFIDEKWDKSIDETVIEALIIDIFETLIWYFVKVCGIDFLKQYKEQKTQKGEKALRVKITQTKKSKVTKENENSYFACGTCRCECIDSPTDRDEQSIQCDKCKLWFHYKCQKIVGTENFISFTGINWFCDICKYHKTSKRRKPLTKLCENV